MSRRPSLPGIRYDCGTAGAELGLLAAPPYDVIDDDLHAALEANDERNSVRLILPRDAGRAATATSAARADVPAWLDDGTLFRDPAPRFYGYRMRFRDARPAPSHPSASSAR